MSDKADPQEIIDTADELAAIDGVSSSDGEMLDAASEYLRAYAALLAQQTSEGKPLVGMDAMGRVGTGSGNFPHCPHCGRAIAPLGLDPYSQACRVGKCPSLVTRKARP